MQVKCSDIIKPPQWHLIIYAERCKRWNPKNMNHRTPGHARFTTAQYHRACKWYGYKGKGNLITATFANQAHEHISLQQLSVNF